MENGRVQTTRGRLVVVALMRLDAGTILLLLLLLLLLMMLVVVIVWQKEESAYDAQLHYQTASIGEWNRRIEQQQKTLINSKQFTFEEECEQRDAIDKRHAFRHH